MAQEVAAYAPDCRKQESHHQIVRIMLMSFKSQVKLKERFLLFQISLLSPRIKDLQLGPYLLPKYCPVHDYLAGGDGHLCH
jgi:hypothetical protein